MIGVFWWDNFCDENDNYFVVNFLRKIIECSSAVYLLLKNTFLFLILKAEGNGGREKDWHGPIGCHNGLIERHCITWSVGSEDLHQAASSGGPQVLWN